MPAAARLDDPIQHSNALTGLLVGAAIGVGVGLFVVATGGLGAGLLAAAVVGGATAAGAGIGEVLGSLSFAGGTTTGGIATGSPDTQINSLLAARATDDSVRCDGTPPLYLPPSHEGKRIAQGSETVSINSLPAARVGDKIECGAKIEAGSPNVIIGGPTVQTLDIDSEVPGYIHAGLFVVGVASAVVLVGPVMAAVGTVASIGGGTLAQWGAAQLGLNEDWQKIAGLTGSLVGGFVGGRGGMALNRQLARMPGRSRLQIDARQRVANDFYSRHGSTYDPRLNGGRGGMRPMKPAEIDSAMRGIDFNEPVEVVTAPRRLGSYQAPGGRQGNYYADRRYTPNDLGIGDYANSPSGPVPKENWLYDIEPGTRALQSRAGPIDDTWSVSGTPQPTDGGGIQYYIPDKSAATLVPGSGQPLLPSQLNPRGPIPGAGPLPTTAGAPPITGSPPVQHGWMRPLLDTPGNVASGGAGQNVINAAGDPKP